jgi:hypothetical protein
MTVETCATLAPQIGCIHLTARAGKFHYTMQATSTFQHADIGVPAWESPINISTSPRRII